MPRRLEVPKTRSPEVKRNKTNKNKSKYKQQNYYNEKKIITHHAASGPFRAIGNECANAETKKKCHARSKT